MRLTFWRHQSTKSRTSPVSLTASFSALTQWISIIEYKWSVVVSQFIIVLILFTPTAEISSFLQFIHLFHLSNFRTFEISSSYHINSTNLNLKGIMGFFGLIPATKLEVRLPRHLLLLTSLWRIFHNFDNLYLTFEFNFCENYNTETRIGSIQQCLETTHSVCIWWSRHLHISNHLSTSEVSWRVEVCLERMGWPHHGWSAAVWSCSVILDWAPESRDFSVQHCHLCHWKPPHWSDCRYRVFRWRASSRKFWYHV